MKRILFVCVIGMLLCACGSSSSYFELEEVETIITTAHSSAEAAEETQTSFVEICAVYICGAVVKPGVYNVPNGSRIVDVLDLAGGISENGDPTVINLAELVYDGERIYIPTFDEVSQGSFPSESSGDAENKLININTAAKEELMKLSGVGEAKAQAIIDYRQKHGGFSSIEELVNVSGIGEASLERLREYITVK